MLHGKQCVISQVVQVETALQLGTTAVRSYQYISDLCNGSLETSLTTDDGVIQTLGRFIGDINARDSVIAVPFLVFDLSKVVKDCKKDCELVRDGVQAWLRDTGAGYASRVGSEPLPLLPDFIARSYGSGMDGDTIRNIYQEREQRAIEKLLDMLKNVVLELRVSLRGLSKFGNLKSRRKETVVNNATELLRQVHCFIEKRRLDSTLVTSGSIFSLSTEVMKLLSESRLCARELFVLRGIDYEHRPARHEGISSAHETTFEWIFDRSKQDTKQSHLLNWLYRGHGIFWVSGKPGSGKSTLMKYITEHPCTKAALRQWATAAGKELNMATHYFWYAGSDIQRSQEGLLRSLLCDIFQQAPELIPIACPERWNKSDDFSPNEEVDTDPWALAELQEAIDEIANQPELKVDFCFFIDGLDEFSGQHLHICKSLLKLSASGNIKLCLASRPWNIFEESFGQVPTQKIYIHELTREDIRKYVEDLLCNHPRWQTLLIESKKAAALVNEVTVRAQGVFLWVFLVTRLLREGLTNYDTLSDLRKRLDTLPSDLEPFFRHMMDSVEPFYHTKMSEMLQMAVKAGKPLPFSICYFHDQEYEDDGYALREPITPWESEILDSVRNIVTRRVNARCMGLMEVNGDNVEFLHRTVYDFLSSKDMEQFLETNTRECFDPHLTILQAYVAWTKHAPFYDLTTTNKAMLQIGESRLKATLLETFSYALQVTSDKSSTISAEVLLDEQEQTVQRIFQAPWSNRPNDVCSKATALFRYCALQAVSTEYIVMKLEKNKSYFNDVGVDPLPPILCQKRGDGQGSFWKPEQLELLRCLLCHGYDPNSNTSSSEDDASTGVLTPWASFAHRLLPRYKLSTGVPTISGSQGVVPSGVGHGRSWPSSQPTFLFQPPSKHVSEALRSGLFRMLLQFGADPNARVGQGDCKLSVWATFLIMGFSNSQSFRQHPKEYLSVLDVLLSRADFSRQEDGLTEAVKRMVEDRKSITTFPTSAFKPLPRQQARKRTMEFICLQLDELIATRSTTDLRDLVLGQRSLRSS
ncbi:hypothetical protein CEP54_003444 [Fusarium duplospermum]|uniref:NACHT domain-containing protein n=1 Tax=Fusarium duplospermum TaxID=1325734 RepID=A0A428QNZ3_9HYPO|nr:hypothetical protein CEP54_003444 [Fusarium duplospermum]